jgi:hypothetical protein
VDVDAVGGAEQEEGVDGVDGDDEFVEGEIGVVLEAEMVHLSFLFMLENLGLEGGLVSILADVPYLELVIGYVEF